MMCSEELWVKSNCDNLIPPVTTCYHTLTTCYHPLTTSVSHFIPLTTCYHPLTTCYHALTTCYHALTTCYHALTSCYHALTTCSQTLTTCLRWIATTWCCSGVSSRWSRSPPTRCASKSWTGKVSVPTNLLQYHWYSDIHLQYFKQWYSYVYRGDLFRISFFNWTIW